MYCKYCGTKRNEGDAFCGNCGKEFKVSDVNSDVSAASRSPDERKCDQMSEKAAVAEQIQDKKRTWNGSSIVLAALALSGQAVNAVAFLDYASLSGNVVAALLRLVGAAIYVVYAILVFYMVRTVIDEEVRQDIFLCLQAGTILNVVLFLLSELIRCAFMAGFSVVVSATIVFICYYKLGQPVTIARNPAALLRICDVLPGLLKCAKNVRVAERQDKRARRAARKRSKRELNRKTVLARMCMGVVCGGIQIVSLFVPMFHFSASAYGEKVYSESFSFRQWVAIELSEDLILLLVLLFAAVAQIVLHLTKKAKLALIPTVAAVLGMILIFFLCAYYSSVAGGYFSAAVGVYLYAAATIMAVIVPFIRLKEKTDGK